MRILKLSKFPDIPERGDVGPPDGHVRRGVEDAAPVDDEDQDGRGAGGRRGRPEEVGFFFLKIIFRKK